MQGLQFKEQIVSEPLKVHPTYYIRFVNQVKLVCLFSLCILHFLKDMPVQTV